MSNMIFCILFIFIACANLLLSFSLFNCLFSSKIILDMTKLEKWLIYKIFCEIKHCYRNILWHIYQSIGNTASIAMNHYCDKRLGIDTDENYHFQDKLSLYRDGAIYQPTPYYLLKKMLRYLNLNRDDVFIDLGCGKGRVVFLAATQKLKKAVGVELTRELADIALENLQNLKRNNTPVEIVHADTATYNIKDGTVFFMFNPFGAKTVAKVISNIKDSLLTNPRKIRIVYYSVAHRDILDNQDWLVPEGRISNTNIFVWHNRYP